MIIFPAIDLKDGACVRLRRGIAEDVKVYAQDPVVMAHHWVAEGATYLHVVDLDGAFKGEPVHTDIIRRIVEAIDIPVQVGGGLRETAHIESLIDCGVTRCIIGTRALADAQTIDRWITRFGEAVVVGIDARNGLVQVKGWVETTDTRAVDLAQCLDAMGVSSIIYTDTARDGMLAGASIVSTSEMCQAVKCNVVASGGVSTVADIEQLYALGHSNLEGAIVGKALYEKHVTLRELCAAAA
ncbi:MAG: 1-(5-phosphoribosyl)-5-[(5-phosphoribosylamino)methylideneamino]imidazole-4-carboxamide isomerase [Verrucomicrobia bacterium]|nr:1-(5-phosphoribosyl)-5-[(5-phosphoribosylamino)methylideneamino]imidazole-4-carboxamide isomerase [Verrucomicrobiota bacterium]